MAALFAGVLLLSGCFESEIPKYRYRLTVEVETPEGLKTGSSVIEVETRQAGKNSFPSPGKLTFRARGEAVAVDLPGNRTMYALLRSENEPQWSGSIMYLLAPRFRGEGRAEKSVFAIMRQTRPRELPMSIPAGGGAIRRDGRPMLVTFGDEADPLSVEKVDPLNLAATFGEGVNLKRITVQATDEPVTLRIEERLGWLREVWPNKLNGERFEDMTTTEPSAKLSANSFSTEIGN